MDVSRIEAAPTKIIDWRRLTAKEIIKYNNEGVEVPPQYLKWAVDFRQDLDKNDKDDTTYEMAEKQKITDAQKQQPIESETVNNEKTTESTDAESESDPEKAPAQDVNNKTPAEKKREEMENAGIGLRGQAKAFIKDSKKANLDDLRAEFSIEDTRKKSTSEIEALESEMTTLISRAESVQSELKNEIDTINSGKSNKLTFAKINRLQQKLQQYGQTGQTKLAAGESDFDSYENIINSKDNIIMTAADFGNETTVIGNDLLASINGRHLFKILDYVIGKKAVHTGEKTVNNALRTDEIKNEASQINKSNQSQVAGLKDKVEDATGVVGFSVGNDSEQTNENKEKIEEQTAAATHTDKAGNATLDQILLAKLRKGQDVQA